MASERSVVVRIRAEVGDFRRQMDQAATATRDMGRVAEQAGQTTSEALTEARSAARDTRAALNDAGEVTQQRHAGNLLRRRHFGPVELVYVHNAATVPA